MSEQYETIETLDIPRLSAFIERNTEIKGFSEKLHSIDNLSLTDKKEIVQIGINTYIDTILGIGTSDARRAKIITAAKDFILQKVIFEFGDRLSGANFIEIRSGNIILYATSETIIDTISLSALYDESLRNQKLLKPKTEYSGSPEYKLIKGIESAYTSTKQLGSDLYASIVDEEISTETKIMNGVLILGAGAIPMMTLASFRSALQSLPGQENIWGFHYTDSTGKVYMVRINTPFRVSELLSRGDEELQKALGVRFENGKILSIPNTQALHLTVDARGVPSRITRIAGGDADPLKSYRVEFADGSSHIVSLDDASYQAADELIRDPQIREAIVRAQRSPSYFQISDLLSIKTLGILALIAPTGEVARKTDKTGAVIEHLGAQAGGLLGFELGSRVPGGPVAKLVSGLTLAAVGDTYSREIINETLDIRVEIWKAFGGSYSDKKSISGHLLTGNLLPEIMEYGITPGLDSQSKLQALIRNGYDPSSLYSRLNRFARNQVSGYTPDPRGAIMEQVFTKEELRKIQFLNNSVENPGVGPIKYKGGINLGINPWEYNRDTLGRDVEGWNTKVPEYKLKTSAQIIDLVSRFSTHQPPFSEQNSTTYLWKYLDPIIYGDTIIQDSPRIFSRLSTELRSIISEVISHPSLSSDDLIKLRGDIDKSLENMRIDTMFLHSIVNTEQLAKHKNEIENQFSQFSTRYSGTKRVWINSIFQSMQTGKEFLTDRQLMNTEKYQESTVEEHKKEFLRQTTEEEELNQIQNVNLGLPPGISIGQEKMRIELSEKQKWYTELLSDTTPLPDQGGMQTNRYFATLLDNIESYLRAKSFFEEVSKGNMKGYNLGA